MNQKIKMKKKVRKLKIGRLLIFILAIILLIFILIKFINKKITNIYVHNNKYIFSNLDNNTKYSEQTLLDIAGISNYPASILTPSSSIRKKIIKNVYIKEAKVYKKNIFEVHIYIKENRPLFYNTNINKTVLETGDTVDDSFNVPILINYVPDKVYEKFIKKMNNIDDSVLAHISEIKYEPNTDKERFLFVMTDGNYVYVSLSDKRNADGEVVSRFDDINDYLDILKRLDRKGVLNLDYGGHFVFE